MPSVQEIRALQRARKKARRRRMYLLGTVLLVAIIAVSVVVYAYIQPGGTNPGLQAVVYAKINTFQGVKEKHLYSKATPQTRTNIVNISKLGFYKHILLRKIAKKLFNHTGDLHYE